jgi:hypothetical protein
LKKRYKAKFESGRKHISKDVFPWLPRDFKLEQIAVFFNVSKESEYRRDFQGGRAITIDELVKMIRDEIEKQGRVGNNAIPEQYDLLRTIQLAVCGCLKRPFRNP